MKNNPPIGVLIVTGSFGYGTQEHGIYDTEDFKHLYPKATAALLNEAVESIIEEFIKFAKDATGDNVERKYIDFKFEHEEGSATALALGIDIGCEKYSYDNKKGLDTYSLNIWVIANPSDTKAIKLLNRFEEVLTK